jgi:hypothetical protein
MASGNRSAGRTPKTTAVVADHLALIARRTPAAAIPQTRAHPDPTQRSSPDTAERVRSHMPSAAVLQTRVSKTSAKASLLRTPPDGDML